MSGPMKVILRLSSLFWIGQLRDGHEMGDREMGYDSLLRPLYQLSQEETDEEDYTIDYTPTLTGCFVKISQKTAMN